MTQFTVTTITTIVRYIPVEAEDEEAARAMVDAMDDREIEEYEIASRETTTEEDVEAIRAERTEDDLFFPPSLCAYCQQPVEPRDACTCPPESKPFGPIILGLYYFAGVLINDQVRTPRENRLGTVIGLTHSGHAQIHIHEDSSITYVEAESLAAWNGLINSGDSREPHQINA